MGKVARDAWVPDVLLGKLVMSGVRRLEADLVAVAAVERIVQNAAVVADASWLPGPAFEI
jgi:hypothetical protein